jgi:hypothetical protein
MGIEGPASVSARVVAVLATFFAGAGVNALVVFMTASSTLAILLLLGVVAGAFATFGNSASVGGLKISGCAIAFPSSGSLTASSLEPAPCFGVLTSLTAGAFGNSVCYASAVEDVPSLSLGTMAVSMYLGRCVKTLIFLPFGTTEMAEATIFLFFPCFREG